MPRKILRGMLLGLGWILCLPGMAVAVPTHSLANRRETNQPVSISWNHGTGEKSLSPAPPRNLGVNPADSNASRIGNPFWTSNGSGLPKSEPAIAVAFGPASADRTNGPHYQLAKFLGGVKRDLVGAVHDWSLVSFAEQTAALARSGVRVEIAIEPKNFESPPQAHCLALLRDAGVKVFPRPMQGGLMHHKFLVADGERVWTGSANFTVTCFYVNYNDVLVIRHRGLADAYRNAFYRLIDPYYAREHVGIPDSFTLPTGETLSAHFSPGPPVPSRKVADLATMAHEEVRFMIFAFSSFPISSALKQVAQKKVPVWGLFDDSFESESVWSRWQTVPFQSLWGVGANVKYDGRRARLHHKAMVIDRRTVITGSYNYSTGADRKNAENFLVLESSNVAGAYLKRHRELWEAFPDRTAYELFVVDRKGQGAVDLEPRSPWPTKSFDATVEEVRHRGEVVLRAGSILYRGHLAALDFPDPGETDWNQEPMATRCREAMGALMAGRPVRVVPPATNQVDRVWLFPPAVGTNLGTSMQEELLQEGWAIVDTHGVIGPPVPVTRLLAAAKAAAVSGRGLSHPAWRLAEAPAAFRSRLARLRLDREAKVMGLVSPTLTSNSVLADRDRGDYAIRGQAAWAERWREWGQGRVLAFPGADAARQAGFRPMRGGVEGWENP